MHWLYEYAEKSGLKVSADGIITSDGDLKISLETFANMVAHATLKQYLTGVRAVMRNGETLH